MKSDTRSLIEGLSYALDAAEKSYLSHSKHVAFISVMIANEMNLDYENIEVLYYSALLHDIGARDSYDIKEHCIVGQDILSKLPIDTRIPEIIYFHHDLYNGTGAFGKSGDDIPLQAQIISVSDVFDKTFGQSKTVDIELLENIMAWIDQVQDFFNPVILEALKKILRRENTLLDYFSSDFEAVLSSRVMVKTIAIDFEGIRKFAEVFSRIIDNRSPFTFEHSNGLAKVVSKVIIALGYDTGIQNEMYISSLLHDLGKLAISNDIIDKPGKLSVEERFEVNKHTYYTRWILEKINGFEKIVDYASNHHEKINGEGYPYHLKEGEIGVLDRIMGICDVYQALTEDRPYRLKMETSRVWSIIDNMAEKNELDTALVSKIKVILY